MSGPAVTRSAGPDVVPSWLEWPQGWTWKKQTLTSYLTDAASRAPELRVATDTLGDMSMSELDDSSTEFADDLRANGVSVGDVVAFQLPNWNDSLIVYYGILKAGAIAAPIVPIYRTHEVRHILKDTAAKVLVVPESFRSRHYPDEYRPMLSGSDLGATVLRAIKQGATLRRGRNGRARTPVLATVTDPAVVMYTSGTTGAPRGVVHNHEGLAYETFSIAALYRIRDGDRIFMASPVTHSTGLLYGLQMPVLLGVNVSLLDVWDGQRAAQIIEAQRCTFTVGATPFLHGLAEAAETGRYDLSSLRVFACGGADISAEVIRKGERALKCTCVRIYGSTEVCTVTASAESDAEAKRAETDGRAIDPTQFRIVDDAGNDAPVGSIGEVYARGPEQLVRYWGESASPFDADGWFHMGDYAVADADGYIRIQGRKKDIIVRGGENISVKEVEDLLLTHPAIKDVAIVGYPDPIMGERACAFVVSDSTDLTLQSVCDFLKAQDIAYQKLPERLQLIAEMPRTASGKIQKYRLRQEAATNKS